MILCFSHSVFSQVGSRPATASASPSSTGSNGILLPPSGALSDGIVHVSVTSCSMQPDSDSSKPPTAGDAATSHAQFDSPSEPVAAVSSLDTAPQSLCVPSVLQHGSSTRIGQGRAVESLPLSQCSPSGLQRSSSARIGSRVQTTGTGDTLVGFLQEQAKAPHAGTQAILPQPASGTHELFVGMVLTDFTIVPSARQHHIDSSRPTGTQCAVRQSAHNSTDGPPSDVAPASTQGSVGTSGQGSVNMAAESKQEHVGAESGPENMQEGMGDLMDGAVMLENPDGSVQYVVLTSDQQRAVQLSMQAKRSKNAELAEGSASQVNIRMHTVCLGCPL